MTSRCIKCSGEMPKDRKGWEQECPKCLTTQSDKQGSEMTREKFQEKWFYFYGDACMKTDFNTDLTALISCEVERAKLLSRQDKRCKHCGIDIAIRNLSGYCDHLYYPEACEVCKKNEGYHRCPICGVEHK
jgi:hypothetical protein